jgi:deazaflavin-dependent oxidoreductase (nitroreductase family)
MPPGEANKEATMWFMNKLVNPLMRLILRSPLHGMMSAALLLLTYKGRRSGKEYTLPVQYAQEKNTLYIMPGGARNKTWWRNLRGGAAVRVTLRGKQEKGKGLVLEAADGIEKIAAGLALFLKRFPSLAKVYQVRLVADGSFNTADLNKAAETVILVRIDLENEQPA